MSDNHQIIGIAAMAAGETIAEAIGEPVSVLVIVNYGNGHQRIVSNAAEPFQLEILKHAISNIENQRQASEKPIGKVN